MERKVEQSENGLLENMRKLEAGLNSRETFYPN